MVEHRLWVYGLNCAAKLAHENLRVKCQCEERAEPVGLARTVFDMISYFDKHAVADGAFISQIAADIVSYMRHMLIIILYKAAWQTAK